MLHTAVYVNGIRLGGAQPVPLYVGGEGYISRLKEDDTQHTIYAYISLLHHTAWYKLGICDPI